MGPGEREDRFTMVEFRRLPGCNRVAADAVSGESCVFRVGGVCEVGLVTPDALRCRPHELVVLVARGARNRLMRTRERKNRFAVIEICRMPRIHRVA